MECVNFELGRFLLSLNFIFVGVSTVEDRNSICHFAVSNCALNFNYMLIILKTAVYFLQRVSLFNLQLLNGKN